MTPEREEHWRTYLDRALQHPGDPDWSPFNIEAEELKGIFEALDAERARLRMLNETNIALFKTQGKIKDMLDAERTHTAELSAALDAALNDRDYHADKLDAAEAEVAALQALVWRSCNCLYKTDPYKAPEQHARTCPVYALANLTDDDVERVTG